MQFCAYQVMDLWRDVNTPTNTGGISWALNAAEENHEKKRIQD